jgi:hypothetical protein
MKPITKATTILSAVLLLAVQSSQAQLFNKLKQKAQSAVNTAASGNPSADTTSNKSGNKTPTATRSRSANSYGTNTNSYDAAKYGTVAFTLLDGEYIVYGEQTLSIVNNRKTVKVVTKQNKQFYIYINGVRKGPYATPPVDQLDNWHKGYQYNIHDDKKTDWQPYIVKGVLVVDGKSYGNYMSLSKFYHNKAKKKFYGLAVKLDKVAAAMFLVSDKGAKKVPLITDQLVTSDNDEIGGVIINAAQYNAKTPKEQYNVVTNDDFYVVLSNGSTKGPYPAVQPRYSWLDNYGNFIQSSSTRNAVFVNGKQLISFTERYSGDGKLFTTANGQSGAWFERGSLFFSDGTNIIDYALQPATSVENGKEVLNWLSIQNKQVYVCKKEL